MPQISIMKIKLMKKLKFIVFEKPFSQNKAYRIKRGGKGIYLTQAAEDYKTHIGWAAKINMIKYKLEMFESPKLEIVFKWNDNKPHDIDNPLKMTIDGLKGVCFEDDKLITDLVVKKRTGQESILVIITE